MVVQGFEDSNHVHRRATDVLKTLKTGWCRAGHERALVCAIGIGLFPEDGDTAQSLLTRAEEALCDLLAIGHNASSFSLRRTLRPPAQERASSGLPQAVARRDGRGSISDPPHGHPVCPARSTGSSGN
jgi:hypothetical protein